MNQKEDAEKLLNSLLPFAHQMLVQYREFFPYGGVMAHDGTITHEGGYNGEEHQPSQTIIDLLNTTHKQKANEGNLRACSVVYDIRTIPPGKLEKQDAIAVAIDHVSGYTVVVMFPYCFDAKQQLIVESPFAVKGAATIFNPQ